MTKKLTLADIKNAEGQMPKANVIKMVYEALDALPFGEVRESAAEVTELLPNMDDTAVRNALNRGASKGRMFKVANQKYIYGSLATITALAAGEGA